ncbi:MAG: hypothetical protein AB8B50_01165 [Pirellulaceae bacterium]
MLRSFCFARLVGLTVAIVLLGGNSVRAQSAYELMPPRAQAAVWIRDTAELLNAWDRTELAQLAKDDSIAPFFEEKRQEIEKRFMDAGWRLNIQPEDVSEFLTGQLGLAWASSPETPIKPYTLVLLADIDEDPKANQAMLKKLETKLLQQKAKKSKLQHAGIDVVKYELPRRPGADLNKRESYLAIVAGKLLVSDDLKEIKQLIDRVKGTSTGPSLANDAEFLQSRALAKISGNAHAEYFVRPIGFAKVIRSIGGSNSKSDTDMIAALEKQGFDAISSICGELTVGNEDLDVRHHGYVHAKMPLTKSARLLDFPNRATGSIPNFVSQNVSSLLVTYWDANKAFWAAEGIVDEIAGTEGVFKEVIKGIAKDVHGPQIDIEQVLPNFTNDIFSIADSRPGPAEVDSRRNMMAFKLRDPAAMRSTLERAMRGEPDAEEEGFQGQQIWKVVHPEEEPLDFSQDDFGDFGDLPTEPDNEANQPWLSNWAITVYDEYLLFASHVELIREAITLGKQAETAPILETTDYQRVVSAINQYFGEDPSAGWRIVRSSIAYRVQYELFRKGELKRSQSMLASILDRLLKSSDEAEDQEQKINGSGLPAFETLQPFLQPGGFIIRTTDSGWEFDGMVLGKQFPVPNEVPMINSDLSSASEFGTARISSAADAKR